LPVKHKGCDVSKRCLVKIGIQFALIEDKTISVTKKMMFQDQRRNFVQQGHRLACFKLTADQVGHTPPVVFPPEVF